MKHEKTMEAAWQTREPTGKPDAIMFNRLQLRRAFAAFLRAVEASPHMVVATFAHESHSDKLRAGFAKLADELEEK